MNHYFFQLFGLRVTLKTWEPVEISQSLQPFLCPPHGECADCMISVDLADRLPQPEGVWHGPECYLHKGDEMQTFHSLAPHGEPFAVTRVTGTGQVQIAVLPAYAGYLSGTSGIFNRIGMENMLLRHSGLLLHASLIEFNGQGIVFTGPSGVGKSTQAELWRRHFGAEVLNGDRAALRKIRDRWMAYGSPYAGTSGIYKNRNVPLTAIVVLRKGKENRIRPMAAAEAFSCIWPEVSLRRWDERSVDRTMELCGRMLADVPVHFLECLPEEGAATVLKKGLFL